MFNQEQNFKLPFPANSAARMSVKAVRGVVDLQDWDIHIDCIWNQTWRSVTSHIENCLFLVLMKWIQFSCHIFMIWMSSSWNQTASLRSDCLTFQWQPFSPVRLELVGRQFPYHFKVVWKNPWIKISSVWHKITCFTIRITCNKEKI